MTDLCVKCHHRPATLDWAGTATAFELAHGFRTQRWCEVCATEAQLAYAREVAARIPDLETKLAHLRTAR